MFSLLAGFFKWLFSKTEVQILILGLDHAGKTTLLEQMKGFFQRIDGIPLDRIPPTVGLNIGRMDINNCRVIFWDLGGQARLRSIWDNYYAEAHGLLFVLDAADEQRFAEAKEAMNSLLCHPDLTGIPMLVCANKQDLHNAKTAEEIDKYFNIAGIKSGSIELPKRKKSTEDLSIQDQKDQESISSAGSMSKTSDGINHRPRPRQAKLQPISALTCAGIEEGITWLVDSAVNNPDIIRARTAPQP
mmetsp:Transcript_17826/g.21649  ORF Transcript_17826/g.21649 Transcript_17826/m.21649 type:complete len:245 (+) Transcript_17826:207-941(+)